MNTKDKNTNSIRVYGMPNTPSSPLKNTVLRTDVNSRKKAGEIEPDPVFTNHNLKFSR